MAWKIRITDEAKKDYNKIEGSIRGSLTVLIICMRNFHILRNSKLPVTFHILAG